MSRQDETAVCLTVAALAAVPGVRHGFFTCLGGADGAGLAGLNVSFDVGDDPARVRRNRAVAAQAIGMTAAMMLIARQVHSARSLLVSAPWPPRRPLPEADALITATPGVAVAVLTADCCPVLCADPVAGVVAAIHAGWRGAVAGVLESALATMAQVGARPARMIAALGPHIAAACYEVGPEFGPGVARYDPNSRPYLLPPTPGRGARFDLGGYVAARLRRAGVGVVRDIGRDTVTESALFYSYRRAQQSGGAPTGRQLSVVLRQG